MFRFLSLFALVLSLTACASQSASDDHATLRNTVAYSSDVEAFASIAEDEKVMEPCPRFMQSINAAEDVVKDRPRDYPHML